MDFIPIDFAHEDQIWVQECMERLTLALELADSPSGNATHRPFRWPPPESHVASILLADALLTYEFPAPGDPSEDATRAITELAIGSVASWLFDLVRAADQDADQEGSRLLQAVAAQRSAQLYARFRNSGLRRCEGRLLQVLLATRVPSAIALGVDLLVEQPPREWSEGSLAISTLLQSSHWNVVDVFPRILDSTNPAVLAPAIDLANVLARERGVHPHPASDRFDVLLSLLGAVTQQLASLEEDPSRFSSRVSDVQRMLFDSVSLAVSLCHFFGLQGDPRAIGKLTQTLDLSHRRIKAEAAFALAKLGEERALDLLLELVEDDANRPRVLAYAMELGIEDRVDPQWHSSLARAKSQLAIWLSQPEQFSLAPQRLEIVEQRTLPWPGMEGPQECFLLRFEYMLGDAQYSNIGFAGPMAHAFPFDLTGLDVDDLFGMFLAQDVDDPSASRTSWDARSEMERGALEALLDQLAVAGYLAIRPQWVLEFLGQVAVVTLVEGVIGEPLWVLTDGDTTLSCKPSPHATDLLAARWQGRCATAILGV